MALGSRSEIVVHMKAKKSIAAGLLENYLGGEAYGH
jgi:hypothetical protein